MIRVYSQERIDAHRKQITLRVYDKETILHSIIGVYSFHDLVDLHCYIHNPNYGISISHDIVEFITRARLIVDGAIKPDVANSFDLPF